MKLRIIMFADFQHVLLDENENIFVAAPMREYIDGFLDGLDYADIEYDIVEDIVERTTYKYWFDSRSIDL